MSEIPLINYKGFDTIENATTYFKEKGVPINKESRLEFIKNWKPLSDAQIYAISNLNGSTDPSRIYGIIHGLPGWATYCLNLVDSPNSSEEEAFINFCHTAFMSGCREVYFKRFEEKSKKQCWVKELRIAGGIPYDISTNCKIVSIDLEQLPKSQLNNYPNLIQIQGSYETELDKLTETFDNVTILGFWFYLTIEQQKKLIGQIDKILNIGGTFEIHFINDPSCFGKEGENEISGFQSYLTDTFKVMKAIQEKYQDSIERKEFVEQNPNNNGFKTNFTSIQDLIQLVTMSSNFVFERCISDCTKIHNIASFTKL